MTFAELPEQGVVFWPVANGDSTTLVGDADTVMQVDLRDLQYADADDAVVAPVIDRLVEVLPADADEDGDGEVPRVAVTAFTHHDTDHCAGAEEYFERIRTDELWVTPRMWAERADGEDLGPHAQAVFDEATRRIEATLAAAGDDPGEGHRIRVLGEHPDEDDFAYADLPDRWRHRVGEEIAVGTTIVVEVLGPNGTNCSLPTESNGRNASSMLLRARLLGPDGSEQAALLLVGDADHTVLAKMFEDAEIADRDLGWDLGLTGHHCSKHGVLDADGKPDSYVLDRYHHHARLGAVLVASSQSFRAQDPDGCDPPHRSAREAYEQHVLETTELQCTAEHPDAADPRPIVFAAADGPGLELLDPEQAEAEAAAAMTAGASLSRADESKTISPSRRRSPRLLAALGATVSAPRSTRRPTTATTPGSTRGSGRDRAGAGSDPLSSTVTRARGRSAPGSSGNGFG